LNQDLKESITVGLRNWLYGNCIVFTYMYNAAMDGFQSSFGTLVKIKEC